MGSEEDWQPIERVQLDLELDVSDCLAVVGKTLSELDEADPDLEDLRQELLAAILVLQSARTV